MEELEPQKTCSYLDNSHQFKYDADLNNIFKIWLMNFILKIATLGMYTFWGKTRIRRYLVSSFPISGSRFEYSGTGFELFLGYLRVIPILIVLYTPFGYVATRPDFFESSTLSLSIFGGLFFIVSFLLYLMAIYASFQYRLSRTRFHGIRFGLGGSALYYGFLCFLYFFINMLTLGLLKPIMDNSKAKYRFNHLYFGTQKADFSGGIYQLYKTYLICWFLAIPTLFLSLFWYKAAFRRYQFEHLNIGGIHFQNTQTGYTLCKLVLINYAILILTLGFGLPLVIQRNMVFIQNHTRVIGDITQFGASQSLKPLRKTGEGLESIFDINSGFF